MDRMKLIHQYQLFLFDFDGLLVNTEELHYKAYKQMMQDHGVEMTWSFQRYCQSAHYSSDKLRLDLSKEFPLVNMNWEELYQVKQTHLLKYLNEGAVSLMPGVEKLLSELQKENINHCVVTHSTDEFVSIVRKQHPLINRIPYWITRYDYQKPKPDPECYLLAMNRYGKPGERTVGFEDTPRGITALLGTKAEPFLITQVPYPEIPQMTQQGVRHLPSFDCFE